MVKFLIRENSIKPITGSFASIGVQTVHLTDEDLERLHPSSAGSDPEIPQGDQITRHSNGRISDRDLLTNLFKIDYSAIDRSSYEGANVILDLNLPIPESYHNKFDFIYSGGSLDNVFDPKTLLENCALLLKPGGRFLSYDVSQGVVGAYLRITPEWLYSWFAVNDWSDCQVYALHQERQGQSRFSYETSLYTWTPRFQRDSNYNYFESSRSHSGIQYVVSLAEKGGRSTSDKIPVQMQYLDENAVDWTAKELAYEQSPRRLHPKGSKKKRPIFDSTHYEFIEENF